MFDKYKKSAFEKKYPLLVEHISDETTRKNMLENSDLLRKYTLYANSISTFIGELNKRFDNDTIQTLIKEIVLKLPDELLESVITAYLNSTEAVKNNAEFLNFYNKTLHLGEDCIRYIERYGIICSRKYLLIPSIIIDDKYNRIKSGNEKFRGESLDKLFYDLTFENKSFVIKLLEKGNFGVFDLVFNGSNASLNALVSAILNVHITVDVFSVELLNKLGQETLKLLIYMLLDMSYVDLSIIHIKSLVERNRIDLIKRLIATRELYYIYELTFDEIDSLNDEEILNRLDKSDVNQLKKDE